MVSKACSGRAQHLGRDAGAGAVEHLFQQRARARRAERLGGRAASNSMLAAPRLSASCSARALDARVVGRHQEEADAAVARPLARDDEQVGGHAFQHEGLLAGELAALDASVARPCPARGAGLRRRPACRPPSPVGDLRQPLRLLRVGAAQDQRAGRGQARGQQRRGGQRAAGSSRIRPRRQVAEVRAAVLLGDDHAGPAHLGHLVPGGGVIAELGAAIAHLAEGGDRATSPGPSSSPRRAACSVLRSERPCLSSQFVGFCSSPLTVIRQGVEAAPCRSRSVLASGRSCGRMTGGVHRSIALRQVGQAQDALGDDVVLDLLASRRRS